MTTIASIWSGFLAWTERHSGGAFLFRGQGDDLPLIPKIARPEYGYSSTREKALFDIFKRRARPFLTMSVGSDWEWLALAQHHGMPTRLIDWSTSPLVAAWFAVTSYPLKADAVVFALETERKDIRSVNAGTGELSDGATLSGPLSTPGEVFLMETSPISSRITTQRGLFTLHGNPRRALRILPPRKFTIPEPVRADFQERLMDFGLDASHIYPDLDGLCKTLDWTMRIRKSFRTLT